MGYLRFRRSIRIAPGIQLNLGRGRGRAPCHSRYLGADAGRPPAGATARAPSKHRSAICAGAGADADRDHDADWRGHFSEMRSRSIGILETGP